MKAQWMLICTLLFALLTAVFAVINVERVRVNFYFAEANLPLILIILGSTLLGGLIVGLIGIIRQYKLQKRIKLLEKQLNAATEPTAVKTDPIPSSAPSDEAVAPDKQPN